MKLIRLILFYIVAVCIAIPIMISTLGILALNKLEDNTEKEAEE